MSDILERLSHAETYGYMPAQTRATIRDAQAALAAQAAELAAMREALEAARPVLSRAMKQAHVARNICGINTPQEREAIEAAQAVAATLGERRT